MMKWYRFLFWRILTWRMRWKPNEPLTEVWALVWLWILHVLNVLVVAIAAISIYFEERDAVLHVLREYRVWLWIGVCLILISWGAWLLIRKQAILKEFSDRDSLRFPSAGDVAVISYHVVTFASFVGVVVYAILKTLGDRTG